MSELTVERIEPRRLTLDDREFSILASHIKTLRAWQADGQRTDPVLRDDLTRFLAWWPEIEGSLQELRALSSLASTGGVTRDPAWLSTFTVHNINHAALDSAVGVLRTGMASGSTQQALWSAIVDYVERSVPSPKAVPEAGGWPVIVDGDKRYALPPDKLSILMGHGLLGSRSDGTYRLSDSEEMESDPGSAGVNNPKALAVLAVVRAALSAAPVPEAGVVTEERDQFGHTKLEKRLLLTAAVMGVIAKGERTMNPAIAQSVHDDLTEAFRALHEAARLPVDRDAALTGAEYEAIHNAGIDAYEAATPKDYRQSATALRRAIDAARAVEAAIKSKSSPATTEKAE